MTIDDYVRKGFNLLITVGENINYGRAIIYAVDAEKYEMVNRKVTAYFKRLIRQEYAKVTNQEIKTRFERDFSKYLKKPRKNP